MPLLEVLELINSNRKSGLLQVDTEPPLALRLQTGEVVGGDIIDWADFEAVSTFDIHSESEHFAFKAGNQSGRAWMAFRTFVAEWARFNDE